MEPVKIVLLLMPTNKVFCSIPTNPWTGCLFTRTHGTIRLRHTHGGSANWSASCPSLHMWLDFIVRALTNGLTMHREEHYFTSLHALMRS